MRFAPAEVPGVVVIEPDVHHDARGYLVETYHAERYKAAGIGGPFVQDNLTRSVAGTIRGLHLQLRRPQGKLIRVVEGEIFDVAVDVRRGSPTFGRSAAVILSAENFRQCYVPPGFAHGFAVVSPVALVEYKCTALYDPEAALGIAWNDPALAISWPVRQPLLSKADMSHPPLSEIVSRLPSMA